MTKSRNIFSKKPEEVTVLGVATEAKFFLATVANVSGTAGLTIIPDGQTTPVPKRYKIMLSGKEAPSAGDRVVVMKHSGTCIILGAIGYPDDISSDDKVSKAGDTMTGPLVMADTNVSIDTSTVTVGASPESNTEAGLLRLRDSAKTIFGRLRGFFGSDGRVGTQMVGERTVNGSLVQNILGLYVNDSGNQAVGISDPAAWRSALGLGTDGNLPVTIRQGGSGQTGTTHTTTVSEILTAEEGWTVTSADYWQWGKLAMVQINIRTTQEVTMSTDTTIATIAAGKRPATVSPAQVWLSTAYTAIISATGALRVGKGSTGTVAADVGFTFLAAYLLP